MCIRTHTEHHRRCNRRCIGIPLQTYQLSTAGPQDCKYGPAGQAASFGTWDREHQVSTAMQEILDSESLLGGGPLISLPLQLQFPWGSGGTGVCRCKPASQHNMSISNDIKSIIIVTVIA